MAKNFFNFFLLVAIAAVLSIISAVGVKADATSTDPCVGNLINYYYDGDHDGYGNPATLIRACSAPQNYVASSSDCNDAQATINPGATEICNGIDDNCDGQIDEGLATTTYYLDSDADGFGTTATTTTACAKPAGYSATSTDCDDTQAKVHPGAAEICNGVDDNCNGQIDEGLAITTYYLDFDGDGFGATASTTQACAKPAGYSATSTDCDDNNYLIFPKAKEACDGIDNNCNGLIDEHCVATSTRITFYQDEDQDGYGDARAWVIASSAPAGYVNNKKDCNDVNADIHPGAIEICDQLDNNCNGKVDEGCKCVSSYCQCDKYLFRNHGSFISCVAHWTNEQKKQNEINGKQKGEIMKENAKNKWQAGWKNFWGNFTKHCNDFKGKIKNKR
ncbi:MAG: putative metal-binding motif-containing protein [Candidatus Falkowbacteria bacterium]|nr:putative metal-binding motif-containing protein [Candidatus Falkowbacteria bacterium]